MAALTWALTGGGAVGFVDEDTEDSEGTSANVERRRSSVMSRAAVSCSLSAGATPDTGKGVEVRQQAARDERCAVSEVGVGSSGLRVADAGVDVRRYFHGVTISRRELTSTHLDALDTRAWPPRWSLYHGTPPSRLVLEFEDDE